MKTVKTKEIVKFSNVLGGTCYKVYQWDEGFYVTAGTATVFIDARDLEL